MSKTPDERALECAVSLGAACAEIGGRAPSLQMTLRDFINSYGANGVIFARAEDVSLFSEPEPDLTA